MPNPFAKLTAFRPAAWWGWLALLAIVLGLTLWLAAKLWSSGEGGREAALASGQRLEITLKDGRVQGKQVSLDKPEPAPVTPEPEAQSVPEGAPPPPVVAPANPDLLEKTPEGEIPKIGADGTLPWKAYARPFTAEPGKPMVAILIADLGQARASFDAALALPPEVTLALSPYAPEVAALAVEARARGHELWVDVLMEPEDFPANDPGPKGLLKSAKKEENIARLYWTLSRFSGFAGVFTPVHEQFSHDPAAVKPVMDELIARGLMTVAGDSDNESYFAHLSAKESSWVVPVDVTIDAALNDAAIAQQFSDLEAQAKSKGFALGLVRPYPISMNALKAWVETLGAKGIALAPVSAVAGKRQ